MEMQPHLPVNLEGCSALGKTAIIKKLGGSLTDYIEMIEKYPTMKYKEETLLKNLEYTTLFFRESCGYKYTDRSFMTNMIYDMIFELYKICSNKSLSSNEIREWFNSKQITKEFWEHVSKYKVLVLLPTSEEIPTTLLRMKERNNGKDILSTLYIQLQCEIYQLWCEKTQWPIIRKEAGSDMENWINYVIERVKDM